MTLYLAVAALGLGLYGVHVMRRDIRRGVATARGFRFYRESQPKRYRALMAFNILSVVLLIVGGILTIVWQLFSN